MSEENSSISAEGVKRRTIIQGAAWSIPAVALMVAAPAAAGTGAPLCAPGTETPRSAPTPVDFALGSGSYIVPAGVTRIRFEIVGGGGGGGRPAPTGLVGNTYQGDTTGGSGAKLSGYITVKESDVVTYIAGAGGAYSDESRSAVLGGKGFGDGGDSPETPAAKDGWSTSSGGGGSAILVNSVAVAVAGGGGGSVGMYGGAQTYYPRHNDYFAPGGDAGLPGGSAEAGGAYNWDGNWPTPGAQVVVPGGGGGTQTAGGLPGGLATWTGATWLAHHWNSSGAAGGAPSVTSGGNGGDGASIRAAINGNGETLYDHLGTSGGGGGYSGGAGGSYTTGSYRNGSEGNWRTANFLFSGAAGGGSSYVGAGVTDLMPVLAGNGGTQAGVRPQGSATIWVC